MRVFQRYANTITSTSASAILNYTYDKCFEIVKADTDALREEAFRLRYQIFCVENNFEDPANYPDELERDAYDRHSRHILLRHRASNTFIGTLRVVMPDLKAPLASFPLQEVCDHPLLHQRDSALRLCEMSRLCISRAFRRRLGDGTTTPLLHHPAMRNPMSVVNDIVTRRVIPYAPMGLFRGAFETILNEGLVDCIAVMEPRLIRTLKTVGLAYTPLGGEIDFHGRRQPITFNLRHVYAKGLADGALFYALMADHGRLYNLSIDNERAWGSALSASQTSMPEREALAAAC